MNEPKETSTGSSEKTFGVPQASAKKACSNLKTFSIPCSNQEHSICPKCHSKRHIHAGRMLLHGLLVQKLKCLKCGHCFVEETPDLRLRRERRKRVTMVLQAADEIKSEIELKVFLNVCDPKDKALVELAFKMKIRCLAESTRRNVIHHLVLISDEGANLADPSAVGCVIANKKFTEAQRYHLIGAYIAYTQNFGIEWVRPKRKYQRPIPSIPLEREIDLLISKCGKVTGVFLQVIKDTGARPGEVTQIEWKDIDSENRTIAINHPLKGSKVRTVKVTPKTFSMINRLSHKTGSHIFNDHFGGMYNSFSKVRRRLAKANPRLLQISFRTLRHWKASTEYRKDLNILRVKDILGHVSIANTMIYTHLVDDLNDDEWEPRRARTPKEEDALIKAGFQYVRYDELDRSVVYRKRK